MKEYIKAGFGVTIGVTIATGLVGALQAALGTWVNKKLADETESKEKPENE